MSMFTILCTKQADAALVEQLQENDISLTATEFIVISPVITEQVAANIKRSNQSVAVFTSANAVNAVKACLQQPSFKVFCLSGKTRTAVEDAFAGIDIAATAADATTLAEKIIASGEMKVVFFCGNKRRDVLPALLAKNNIEVDEIIVYETIETPVKLNNHFDAVLFYSPSAVKSYFTVNKLHPGTVCFSIGETTAAEIKNYTNNQLIVADTPSGDQLATQVIQYFKQVQC